MIAAENALNKAKYGMFCIPGIARLEDIDLAAKHNMGFIRIGTNVTEVPDSEEFIRRAKDNGMFVTANFMKSYVVPPDKFAEYAKLSEKYGADLVYIVDSAGGMFSDEIKADFQAIRKVSDIPIGFHGHDNLGLAIANSLEGVKMGVEFVDSSLQGLGRSSGNASTEILVGALQKMGYDLEIDFLKLLHLGQDYIRPMLTVNGRDVLDIVAGYADFHSSYMRYIEKVAAKYSIDPAILIVEWCKVDKVNMDEKALEERARKIQGDKRIYTSKYGFAKYIGDEQSR
jgi:4-hydroxy 2-oxovalerate aldolase/long-chain acyl-CoA synthetase